jgi:uncharacterized protein YndB with AHSA1/START domain
MKPDLIVEKSVEIAASGNQVWRALTEPDLILQWMSGAQVESTWQLGSGITFSGTMPNFNKKYRDRGTVLSLDVRISTSHNYSCTLFPSSGE